jgi:hypothetical protein
LLKNHFSCKGFAIILADSRGMFKVSETTPVKFLVCEKRKSGRRRKENKNLSI